MALSILTALYQRDRTGEGQWIDASQTEVGIFLTAVQVLDWSANDRTWRRFGNHSPLKPAVPHGIYRCAGHDRWLAIACSTDGEWRSLAQVAGRDEWLRDPRFATLEDRMAHQDALDRFVEEWTCSQEPYALMNALQAAGVPAGVCQTAGDRYDNDPQLRHLGWLTELPSTRLGTWPLGETAIRFSDTPAHIGGMTRRGAPLYGEDNVAILTELLGLTESEIAELAEKGIL
jgi:crotonobetainyl-CoA:carnitine CoA-transferase CaiB-like acyl-CoA transferase